MDGHEPNAGFFTGRPGYRARCRLDLATQLLLRFLTSRKNYTGLRNGFANRGQGGRHRNHTFS